MNTLLKSIILVISISINTLCCPDVWAKDAGVFIFSDHNSDAFAESSTELSLPANADTSLTDEEAKARALPSERPESTDPVSRDMMARVEAVDEDFVQLLSRIIEPLDWHLNIGDIGKIKVNLQLSHLSARDAVQIICDRHDLVCFFEGPAQKILRIMSEQEYQEEFGGSFKKDRLSDIVALQYLDFLPIRPRLEPFLTATGRMIEQGRAGLL
jgi:hypothetical protein